MTEPPTVELPSGDDLPAVGVGTRGIGGDSVKESVRTGLDAGYGHVDTAEGYENEAGIGEALSDYDRNDVFLTSKVLPKYLDYESVIESCEASLDKLGTDYLDTLAQPGDLGARDDVGDDDATRSRLGSHVSVCRTSRPTS